MSTPRPNNWPPPPPSSSSTSAHPFPRDAPRSPTSTSHSGTSSSETSEHSPASPMPLVVFSQLAVRGNGPADAIERMRREFHRPGSAISDGRYTASIDDRAYIPVFEFPLGSQTIMIDSDSGYVLWTAIWKSLGNSKADIVKLVDSYDGLEEKIIKIRGGYLKIQGTWVPYEVALKLAQRVAFSIRHELVPLFGPTFPESCFLPGSLGYGQVTLAAPGSRPPRRAPRRIPGPEVIKGTTPTLGRPPSNRTDWTSSNPVSSKPNQLIGRSSSMKRIGSSAGGREPSGGSGSGGGERWSPYPYASSSSAVYHSDPAYEEYYRQQQSPYSNQSPPSSYPASGSRGSGFHLPSPHDPLLRSQHSEPSLPPRSRQSTYSENDAMVLRRFSTSLVDSPPLREFGFSIPSSASFPSSSSFGRSGPSSASYRPSTPLSAPPSSFSLPPISSLTPQFAFPGVPSSVARRTSQQQQSQSYRILSVEEHSQRGIQGSPISPGSSSDSQQPSSGGSQGGSAHGRSVAPLTPLGFSHPSSTSSSSSSVFEGGPSYLPPITSLDEPPPFRTSTSYSQRDRAPSHHLSTRHYPSNIEVSPSTVLRGLRVDDGSSEGSRDRRHGGVPMDVDRSTSSSQMTEKGLRYLDDETTRVPYLRGLGVYFPPERVEPTPAPSSSYLSGSAGPPSTGSYYPRGSESSTASTRMDDASTSPSVPPSPATEERQLSTSFRPW